MFNRTVFQSCRFLDRALSYYRKRSFNLFSTPFHLVTVSPWPFFVSLALFIFIFGFASFLHSLECATVLLKSSFLLFLWSFVRWLTDVVYEGFDQGYHTIVVQRGLRIGFALFIFSEIMFFSAFFWAFFHSSLAPAVEIGMGWPPVRGSFVLFSSSVDLIYLTLSGIVLFDPWCVPFVNTLLLLGSGIWLTYAHAIMRFQRKVSARSSRRVRLLPTRPTGYRFYSYIRAQISSRLDRFRLVLPVMFMVLTYPVHFVFLMVRGIVNRFF